MNQGRSLFSNQEYSLTCDLYLRGDILVQIISADREVVCHQKGKTNKKCHKLVPSYNRM